MHVLTRWKIVERPTTRADAPALAGRDMESGAVGAVTSWGSGISHRETLRVFWNVTDGAEVVGRGFDPAAAEDLVEEDWRAHWRESLSAFRAGTFTLIPAWEKVADAGEERVIRIDPGMAFGAGDHPTTRLCVEALEELAALTPLPVPVLDVGAGTGVLSIVAAKLGLKPVTALDIDPFCYASTLRNARRNGVGSEVRAVLLSLDLLEGEFGLALANVAPRQLVAMAQTLSTKVEKGGLLLLSGFQEDNEARVIDAFGGEFKTVERRSEEEWLALLLKKV